MQAVLQADLKHTEKGLHYIEHILIRGYEGYIAGCRCKYWPEDGTEDDDKSEA